MSSKWRVLERIVGNYAVVRDMSWGEKAFLNYMITDEEHPQVCWFDTLCAAESKAEELNKIEGFM